MRFFYILPFVFLLSLAGEYDNFSKSVEDGILLSNSKYCEVCGMELRKFYKTNHIAKLSSGKFKQYSEIRDFIDDGNVGNDKVVEHLTIDAKTSMIIYAKSAYYVVGSSVRGTMSKISKLAFKNKDDALKFIEEKGGELKNLEQAIEIAKQDLHSH